MPFFLGEKKIQLDFPRCCGLNMPKARRPDKKAHGLHGLFGDDGVQPSCNPRDSTNRFSPKTMETPWLKCISLGSKLWHHFLGIYVKFPLNICRVTTINLMNLVGKIGNPSWFNKECICMPEILRREWYLQVRTISWTVGVLPIGSNDFQLSEHLFPAASASDVKQFVDGSYLDILGVCPHTSNSNHQDDGRFV